LEQIFERSKTKVSIGKISEVILVGGSTYIPKVKEIVETFTNKKSHSRIPPDLVVAHGAGILAALLAGTVNDKMSFMDVVSKDIGVEVKGCEMSPIVRKDSHLPANKDEKYKTMSNFQDSIRLKVLEGNCLKSSENKVLKEEILTGFKSGSKKVPFNITVNVSVDGLVDVNVECLESDWKKTIHCSSLSSVPCISPGQITQASVNMHQLLQGEPLLQFSKKVGPILEGIKKLDTIIAKAKTLDTTDKSELEQIERWINKNRKDCNHTDVESKIKEVLNLSGDYAVVLQDL